MNSSFVSKSILLLIILLNIFLFVKCTPNNFKLIDLNYTINSFDLKQDQMDVSFRLINKSNKDFNKGQWSLHWNQILGEIIPQSLPNGIKFKRVNGNSYFILEFDNTWNLRSGGQISFNAKTSGIASRLALGPVGAFVVQNANTFNVQTKVDWKSAKGLENLKIPNSKTRYHKYKEMKLVSKDSISWVIPTPSKIVFSSTLRPAADILDVYLKDEINPFRENISTLLSQTGKKINFVQNISDANLVFLFSDDFNKEEYQLKIDPHLIKIVSNTYSGFVYGIQSLVQIDGAAQISDNKWPIIEIFDQPRFTYRGFLLDISRNFYGLSKIKQIIDLMSLYKLNHLELKLTDDEGWRLEIPDIPDLTDVGAKRGYSADEFDRLIPMYGSGPDGGDTGNGFLSRKDFIELLVYAKQKNVTVIPQISFPSHARAAIIAMKSRTKRLREAGDYEGAYQFSLSDPDDKSIYQSAQLYNDNAINICMESSYTFFQKVVDEVLKMYLDAGLQLKQFSIGADELPYGVWENSPICLDNLKPNNSISGLYDANIYRLKEILNKHGINLSGWEDFMLERSEKSQSETKIKSEHYNYEVIPYVWNNTWGKGREDMNYKFANLGFKTVMSNSSAFYFDMADDRDMDSHGLNWSGHVDYLDTWAIDPEDVFANTYLNKKHNLTTDYISKKIKLDPSKRSNLLGIQSQLFGETVRNEKILNEMLIPNLLVFAQRAWSIRPSWIDKNGDEQISLMFNDWNMFANNLGQRTIPFLNHQFDVLNIHLPKPGAVIKNDSLFVRVPFPGLQVRYTTDGSIPSKRSKIYKSGILVDYDSVVKLRSFDNNLNGGGYIEVKN